MVAMTPLLDFALLFAVFNDLEIFVLAGFFDSSEHGEPLLLKTPHF